MIQEENQLLFIDLCGRLPHRVICHSSKINLDGELLFINKVYNIIAIYNDKAVGKFDTCSIVDVKPYLRPMSSMTEEEAYEYNTAIDKDVAPERIVDWYNLHHIDYRGLIPMGLALEAPEGMYKDN